MDIDDVEDLDLRENDDADGYQHVGDQFSEEFDPIFFLSNQFLMSG